MGDTIFNIFDNNFEAAHKKQANLNKLAENAYAGKKTNLSKGLTPRLNKNFSTPKLNDPKRKTFLQNEGASIQMFCPKKSNLANKKSGLASTLQVYEDDATQNTKKQPDDASGSEYNRKSMYYDDTSDHEFDISDEKMNNIAFGLPSKTPFCPSDCEKPEMIAPVEPEYTIDDIFPCDMNSNCPELDDFDLDFGDTLEPIIDEKLSDDEILNHDNI